MSEILSHYKVDEFYREGLKYPAFITTLNEYQQRKVLEVCEASIRKGSIHLQRIIELNLDNLNERNLDVAREVIMGKQLRLRNALWLALGILKKDEPMQQIVPSDKEREHQKTESFTSELNAIAKELVAALNNRLEPEQKTKSKVKKVHQQKVDSFSSYINKKGNNGDLEKILEIGNGLRASKLASFLFALDAEGILKTGFLEQGLMMQHSMVIEQFSFTNTKAALGQELKKCEGANPKRKEEIAKFQNTIKSILQL